MNLEKELLRINKPVVSARELLLIKEFESKGDMADDRSLRRMGILGAIEDGRKIKTAIDHKLSEVKKFDQTRVFHIDQIAGICKKYYLRFLPTHLYKGSIDRDLPQKIGTFELAHNVTMTSSSGGHYRNSTHSSDTNSFVCAPKESFALQSRPIDPLLFYKINDDYYYLIHKWGNDLSWSRRLKGIFSRRDMSYLAYVVMWVSFASIIGYLFGARHAESFGWTASIAFLLVSVVCGMSRADNMDGLGLYPVNYWRSDFKD